LFVYIIILNEKTPKWGFDVTLIELD